MESFAKEESVDQSGKGILHCRLQATPLQHRREYSARRVYGIVPQNYAVIKWNLQLIRRTRLQNVV